MRIAIVSDIHGNRAAFEAVLADLREASPDLVLHGGDLAHGGSACAEMVDRIRELGWRGVAGNTDEMLWRPEALPQQMRGTVGEIADAEQEIVGDERLAWLRALPADYTFEGLMLVHARPGDFWRAPGPEASDAELESVYGAAGSRVAVYGHIHRPYVRRLPRNSRNSRTTVVNTGSVSLSFDGDRRAAYLLLDKGETQIRRVEYDVETEIRALQDRQVPHADWLTKMLRTASPQMP